MKQTSKPNIFEIGKTARPTQPSPVEVQTVLTLFQQGKMPEVYQHALRMTQQFPNHGFGWKMLGVAYRVAGRVNDALKPMQTACKLMPRDHEAFNNLGSTLQALGDTKHAEPCYQHAIDLKPDYVVGVANMAHMLFNLNRGKEALPLFERKLKLDPSDDYVRHLVAFLRGDQNERATAAYVTRTFDDYAETFETHLVSGLQYSAPERLTKLIDQSGLAPQGKWRVLDLGCGTGLVGVALGERAGELIGVDLSERMLDKAREKKLYQSLICSDLLPAMQAEPAGSVDLVIAADVFIYIGKIDEIVQQAKRVLRSGGLLAFSIEDIEMPEGADAPAASEPDHQLKPTGRYGQSAAYLARLAQAHGFKPIVQEDGVLRLELDVPVHGKLVVWQA